MKKKFSIYSTLKNIEEKTKSENRVYIYRYIYKKNIKRKEKYINKENKGNSINRKVEKNTK